MTGPHLLLNKESNTHKQAHTPSICPTVFCSSSVTDLSQTLSKSCHRGATADIVCINVPGLSCIEVLLLATTQGVFFFFFNPDFFSPRSFAHSFFLFFVDVAVASDFASSPVSFSFSLVLVLALFFVLGVGSEGPIIRSSHNCVLSSLRRIRLLHRPCPRPPQGGVGSV